MKNGSKSSQKQGAGILGKREAPEGKNSSKGSSEGGATPSTAKDMEAELLRLMRENDKLKNQLSDSQGEVFLHPISNLDQFLSRRRFSQVKRLKEVIDCHETQKKAKTEDSKSQSRYISLWSDLSM